MNIDAPEKLQAFAKALYKRSIEKLKQTDNECYRTAIFEWLELDDKNFPQYYKFEIQLIRVPNVEDTFIFLLYHTNTRNNIPLTNVSYYNEYPGTRILERFIKHRNIGKPYLIIK